MLCVRDQKEFKVIVEAVGGGGGGSEVEDKENDIQERW